ERGQLGRSRGGCGGQPVAVLVLDDCVLLGGVVAEDRAGSSEQRVLDGLGSYDGAGRAGDERADPGGGCSGQSRVKRAVSSTHAAERICRPSGDVSLDT